TSPLRGRHMHPSLASAKASEHDIARAVVPGGQFHTGGAHLGRVSTMSAPTIDPERRHPTDVAPTDSYRPADPVWVYRSGTWRAGVVAASSARAAAGTARPTDPW